MSSLDKVNSNRNEINRIDVDIGYIYLYWLIKDQLQHQFSTNVLCVVKYNKYNVNNMNIVLNVSIHKVHIHLALLYHYGHAIQKAKNLTNDIYMEFADIY